MAKKDSQNTPPVDDEEIIVEEVKANFSANEPTVLDKFNRNRKIYAGLLVAAVVLVAGFFWYRSSQAETEAEAMDKAELAFRAFYQDSLNLAINGTATFAGLEKIKTDYEGTRAANLARYMLGTAKLQLGKTDEGIKDLEDMDKGDEQMLNASAYFALGYAYEEKGKYAEAAEKYRQAADLVPNESTSPLFLMRAAQCHELGGKPDEALKVYQEILKKYPRSQEGQQVEKYIARLQS
ncbi:MAG: tetratricopeptide repeat protein [Bacteroidetes bacterium]|nr:tetratricopeptide repeat protein [Bacteroidota bacterium]